MDIYHVIVEGMHHDSMEIASWCAQLFIVLVTIVGALVARYQLKEMGIYRRQRVLIANAQILLGLDNRWDSIDMQESRRIFQTTRDVIHDNVVKEHLLENDEARTRLIEQAWISTLRDKRSNNSNEYVKLMAICGFFETVGLMVERDYIKYDDALELFEGPIRAISTFFAGHIAARETETGVSVGLYKHALKLSRRAAAGSK